MTAGTLVGEIRKLDRDEQIQVVEELWNKIAESPEPLPLSEAQRSELRRRKANRQESLEPTLRESFSKFDNEHDRV